MSEELGEGRGKKFVTIYEEDHFDKITFKWWSAKCKPSPPLPTQAVNNDRSLIYWETGHLTLLCCHLLPGVRCSTNWAMKPHIGSEINWLSSYLPWGVGNDVKWYEMIHILYCSCRFFPAATDFHLQPLYNIRIISHNFTSFHSSRGIWT